MDAYSVDAESIEEEEVLTVDKMIHLTFETHDRNVVNFRLLQSILHILAHRMKILEQDVDIRIEERDDVISALKEKLRDIDISSLSESDFDMSESEASEKEIAVDSLTGSDKVKSRGVKGKKDATTAGKQTGKAAIDKSKGKSKDQRQSKATDKKKQDKKGGASGKKAGAGLSSSDESESDDSEGEGKRKGAKSTSKKGDKTKKRTIDDDDASSLEDTDDDKSSKGKKGKQSKKDTTADSTSTDGKTSKDKKGKVSKKGDTADSAEKYGDDKKKGKKKGKLAGEDDDDMESRTKKGKKSDEDGSERTRKKKRGKVGVADDDDEYDDDDDEDQAKKGKMTEDRRGKKGRTKKGEDLQEDKTSRGDKGKQKKGDEKGGPKSKPGAGTLLDTLRKKAQGRKDTVGRGTMTRGSVELVTRSQFDLLRGEVGKLRQKNEPFPLPSMPDNLMIKEALSKGTTTLTGAMEAMQLNARVRAAEQALTRITELLGALATAGAFPESMTGLIEQLFKDKEELAHLMEAGDKVLKPQGVKSTKSTGFKSAQSGMSLRLGKSNMQHAGMPSTASMTSSIRMPPPDPLVTSNGLSEAIENMKCEMVQHMVQMTDESTAASEQAQALVRTVGNKLVIALTVNGRINELDAATVKHTEQLNGFDAGLTAQLETFQQQMKEMKTQLKGGLIQLASDSKLESLAVAALQRGQEKMELMVDQARYNIHSLMVVLKKLSTDTKNLKVTVQMVDEEKVNRQDLLRALEDKVDLNRLRGLLKEESFEVCRKDLDHELDICFEKFTKMDCYWIDLLKEKKKELGSKAKLLDLYILKDFTTGYLNDLQDILERLELEMGDPQVAKLTRELSRNAYCASCMIAAHMAPFDKTYGKPPEMPALTLKYFGNESDHQGIMLHPPDERKHISNRWVGGSHTVMSQHTTPRSPHTQFKLTPTRRYAALADDGRIYMMEEEIPPCDQCKDLVKPEDDLRCKSKEIGGGDQHLPQDEYNQEQASNMSLAGSSILN